MRISLGELIPVLEGWFVCEKGMCSGECVVCVELPSWCRGFDEKSIAYILLYLAARTCMDYRLAAALHVYSVRNKVFVKPDILLKAWRESKILSRMYRRVEDDSIYAWRATLYHGILYAQSILDLEKPVLVKITPPRDKRVREKLRVLLEGKRVTIKGKTYQVGGLIKKIGGKRVASWIYIVPKKNISKLMREAKERQFKIDILLR